MKKIFFQFIFLFLINQTYSQSLSLSSNDSVFNISNSTLFSTNLIVENISENVVPIKIFRQTIEENEGSSNYFCWQYCYLPNTNFSTVSINFQQYELNDSALSVYYNPGNLCGKTIVKYCAYNENLISDSSCVTITYNNPKFILDTLINACDSISWDNQIYFNNGTYQFTYPTTNSCDSILNVDFIIESSNYINNNLDACDSLQIENNIAYESGVYNYIYTNNKGCDSVISYNVSILESYQTEVFENECDSLFIEGIAYYESGTYINSYISSNNCDSVVITYLELNTDEIDLIHLNDLEILNEDLFNINWFFNGEIIGGANDYILSPIQDGYYHATAENNLGCILTSDFIFVSTNNIDENVKKSEIIQTTDFLGRKINNQKNIKIINFQDNIIKQIYLDKQ